MSDRNTARGPTPSNSRFWRSRFGIVLLGFGLIAGLMLVYEHRVHLVFGNAWVAIFLVFCVGMHLFMHGGRGHQSGTRDREEIDHK